MLDSLCDLFECLFKGIFLIILYTIGLPFMILYLIIDGLS